MGTLERRRREREAVRTRLLEVSWELFSSLPAAEVTMRLIADRAEYSPRTLYLYFTDREALLAAVVEEAFRRTREAQDGAAAAGGDRADLRAFLRDQVVRHVVQGLGRPRLYETVFFELWRPGAPAGPNRQAVEARICQGLEGLGLPADAAALGPVLLRAFTLTLVREGRRPDDPEVAVRTGHFADLLLGAGPLETA